LSATSEPPVTLDLFADPRLERLLTIGKVINDLLAKIRAATAYLATESAAEDLGAVEVARNQLVRDLSREFAEARELLPSLDEITSRLQERQHELEQAHQMSLGLARIEGLSGTEKQKEFLDSAESSKAKIAEIGNLISALDALQGDLGAGHRTPHVCPRCSSSRVSYRIALSDMGYTLYKCDDCNNAWRITSYSLHLA